MTKLEELENFRKIIGRGGLQEAINGIIKYCENNNILDIKNTMTIISGEHATLLNGELKGRIAHNEANTQRNGIGVRTLDVITLLYELEIENLKQTKSIENQLNTNKKNTKKTSAKKPKESNTSKGKPLESQNKKEDTDDYKTDNAPKSTNNTVGDNNMALNNIRDSTITIVIPPKPPIKPKQSKRWLCYTGIVLVLFICVCVGIKGCEQYRPESSGNVSATGTSGVKPPATTTIKANSDPVKPPRNKRTTDTDIKLPSTPQSTPIPPKQYFISYKVDEVQYKLSNEDTRDTVLEKVIKKIQESKNNSEPQNILYKIKIRYYFTSDTPKYINITLEFDSVPAIAIIDCEPKTIDIKMDGDSAKDIVIAIIQNKIKKCLNF